MARAGIAAVSGLLALALLISDPALASTVGDQDQPALARASDGGFLVVWRRYPGGVRAQRYDAIGTPVGEERVVSPDSSSDRDPAVARLRDGRFLVVWQRSGTGIVGHVLDAAGAPQGRDIAIATSVAFGGLDLAINDKGRGLVIWTGDDGDNGGIFARPWFPPPLPLLPEGGGVTSAESSW